MLYGMFGYVCAPPTRNLKRLPLRGAPAIAGEGWLGCDPCPEGHPSVTFGDSSPLRGAQFVKNHFPRRRDCRGEHRSPGELCVRARLPGRIWNPPLRVLKRLPLRGAALLYSYAPKVAAMTALMVCMRFSASWKTMDCGPLKTSSVTSMASRSNFSPISLPTAVLWSW